MRTWKIDSQHSNISFLVRHMLVSKVRGELTRFSGELKFSEKSPEESSVVVEIDAASVDTHEPRRDAHLRSSDFLDVGRFPFIYFRSTAVKRVDATSFQVTGELTIRDVTREVQLDVAYGGRMRDPSGVERVGFSARTVIDRKAFGVTFNQILDSGGLALGNKLEVAIEAEAVEVVAAVAQSARQVNVKRRGVAV
jgi:polyisoprenoid-binding protein YceI